MRRSDGWGRLATVGWILVAAGAVALTVTAVSVAAGSNACNQEIWPGPGPAAWVAGAVAAIAATIVGLTRIVRERKGLLTLFLAFIEIGALGLVYLLVVIAALADTC